MQQLVPSPSQGEPAMLVEDLKRRYEALKADAERANAQQQWEEIAEVMDPNHRGFVGRRTPGEKRMQKVFDATGIHAADLLTAGLHGTATNPSTKWHRLATQFPEANKNKAIREHLDRRTEILFARRYTPGANFTTALNDVYNSAGRYGTGIMYVTTRRDGRNLYECRALSECVMADNDEGDSDTLMRQFSWTARQCVQEWGDKVSPKVKELIASNKPDTPVDIIHAVYPRREHDKSKKNALNMPFASVYFELQSAQKLEESGYRKFPFAIFRWSKRPGETYGTGPGATALPDVKMLQAMMLVVIKASQKVADPPLFLPDDGFVGQTIRTVPGALNFNRSSREVVPMPVSGNLPVTLEIMEELRNRIRQTFFTDILQFVTDKEMTATEVQQRTAERMRLLGPVLGRLEGFLGAIVDIEDDIASAAGVLPPVPEEFSEESGLIPAGLDVELIVEYVGPIFQAQRAADANGFAQMMQYAAPLVEAQPASFARSYSTDRIISWLGRTFMVPAELETTEDEKAQITRMEQAQAAAAAGQPMADAANKGAGAVKQLADAQAGGGIDLRALMAELGRQEPIDGGALSAA